MKYIDRLISNCVTPIIIITATILFIFIVVATVQLVNVINVSNFSEGIAIFIGQPIVKAIGVLLSFFVAAITLKKTIDIQTVNSLAKLRELLNTKEKKEIHERLINKPYYTTEIGVEELDYIGTIELGAIMHRKGIINDVELYNQFGYRVENIVNSSLLKKISEDSKYYEDFIYIKKIIEKFSIKNKISSKVIH